MYQYVCFWNKNKLIFLFNNYTCFRVIAQVPVHTCLENPVNEGESNEMNPLLCLHQGRRKRNLETFITYKTAAYNISLYHLDCIQSTLNQYFMFYTLYGIFIIYKFLFYDWLFQFTALFPGIFLFLVLCKSNAICIRFCCKTFLICPTDVCRVVTTGTVGNGGQPSIGPVITCATTLCERYSLYKCSSSNACRFWPLITVPHNLLISTFFFYL